MIKKIFLIVSFGILLFAGSGWSITITDGPYSGTDVGSIDTLEGYISQADFLDMGNGGGESAEAIWMETLVGEVDYVQGGLTTYYSTDTTDVFAFKFSSPFPEYFLVKNSTFRALFTNEINFGWGVFDTGALPGGINLGTEPFQISHVGTAGIAPVPEPTTMLLFGVGLVGLAGISRKKKS